MGILTESYGRAQLQQRPNMDVESGAAVAPDPQPAPSGWLSSFVSGILSYMTGHDLQPEVDYATYKHHRRAA